MAIKISKENADKLNEGIKFGNGAELPFPVLYVQVRNGQANMASQKQTNPMLYYGGFLADQKPMEDLLETGLENPGFTGPLEMSDKSGKSYMAYTTRYIFVAPIGYRKSWVKKDGRGSERRPEKVGIRKGERGFRHHMQVLAYMGYKTTGSSGVEEYLPWNPVVITAYGYQVDRLTTTFNDWNKHTAQARNLLSKEAGTQIPAWCFYLAIGTFGKDRVQEMVGQGENQSPITPIRAYLPDPLPGNLMESLFVGEGITQQMTELREQASEWLEAWNKGVSDDQATGADEGPETGQTYGNEPEFDDDIPF